MSISTLGLRTTTFTATTTACWEMRATGDRAKLLELSFIMAAATQVSIGLGRPQAIGITPVNVAFQPEDPAEPASNHNCSLSWATSPTVPLIYHRRLNLIGAVGFGATWLFPRGIVVPAGSSLVLWNITTTAAADVNAIIDE